MDIFSTLKDPSTTNKAKLLRACHAVCFNSHVDILDCSVSWARQRTDLTLDDALNYLDDSCHFVIIKRSGEWSIMNDGKSYYEVGFSTMGGITVDYFLFIYLSEEAFDEKIRPQFEFKDRL